MLPSITIVDLKTALDAGETSIIDVRETYEFATGHVPGAVNIPMATIPVRLQELPASPVYVVCESGGRSAQVVMFLQRHGIEAVNVDGGTSAWRMSGLPIEQ